MLSKEDNELLTRIGPGTPMGSLIRRFWVPVSFSEKIAKRDGPPVRVRILGENLVLFRDTEGRIGLVDERCPHRTASLYYGRNEQCGIRCVYHGWKFDVDGNCVDLPSEPPSSGFRDKIRIKAYACHEAGGLVWAYMGAKDLKPEFPELEWTTIPASHRFVTRHIQECNWLQGLEGGFDTSHLSFLHGGAVESRMGVVPGRYEIVPGDFGFVAGTGRDLEDGNTFWTAAAMLMPFHKIIPSDPMAAHVWAPIDDENTMLYSIDFNPTRPLTEEDLKRSKTYNGIHTQNIPGTDRAIQNKDNEYMIDRELQSSGKSFTGMKGLGIQDCAIQESMGPIADRTLEHLGVSDTAIIRIRRILLKMVKDEIAGASPNPPLGKSYRIRSARFTAPRDRKFADMIHEKMYPK
ncbi:MAG: Rieske 2Fe-2S domain-containing protein [Beijerinckiaceae bacterium]